MAFDINRPVVIFFKFIIAIASGRNKTPAV
jgi:hypothetical protein